MIEYKYRHKIKIAFSMKLCDVTKPQTCIIRTKVIIKMEEESISCK